MRDKFDRKAQMMDAGTAFFEAKEGYGSILGEIKAEMEVYGKVLKISEIDNKELPFTTKECDLFLDFSNAFRHRYISCLLMDAGDTGKITDKGEHIRRYAAVFKEGNTSSGLRNMFIIIIIAIFTAIGVYGFMQYILAGFIYSLLLDCTKFCRTGNREIIKAENREEPLKGFEPSTCSLRMSCSTD